jgi:hypothetical protein
MVNVKIAQSIVDDSGNIIETMTATGMKEVSVEAT